MKKFYKITFIVFLCCVLVAIRGFAKEIFYDPLQIYFYNDYLYSKLPELDNSRLLFFMSLRYTINSLVSLLIIWVIFKKKRYVKFSVFFYVVTFIVLIIVFGYFLNQKFESGYLLPFYIRRFIIHPVFLLLLLPAFYYQKLNSK
jgi:exosortase F-associated protein